jgi:hypothetical protein
MIIFRFLLAAAGLSALIFSALGAGGDRSAAPGGGFAAPAQSASVDAKG